MKKWRNKKMTKINENVNATQEQTQNAKDFEADMQQMIQTAESVRSKQNHRPDLLSLLEMQRALISVHADRCDAMAEVIEDQRQQMFRLHLVNINNVLESAAAGVINAEQACLLIDDLIMSWEYPN